MQQNNIEKANNWLLLGSLDLCNSTEIKSYFENKSEDYKKELYLEYLRKIFNLEFSFYSSLFKEYLDLIHPNARYETEYGGKVSFEKIKSEENIFEKLFVLKHIGDEIWFSIEIPYGNTQMLRNVTYAIYSALMGLREDNINIFNHKPPESKTREPIKDKTLLLEKESKLRFKGYFDLIENAIDAPAIKSDTYMKQKDFLMSTNSGHVIIPEYYQKELLEKFNISYIIDEKGKKLLTKQRTDLVGYEIDRFFRYTKHSANKIFCIGGKLFKQVFISKNSKKSSVNKFNIESLKLNVGIPPAFCKYFLYIEMVKQEKGIIKPYALYYLRETKTHILDIKYTLNELKGTDYQYRDSTYMKTFEILNKICAKYKIELDLLSEE